MPGERIIIDQGLDFEVLKQRERDAREEALEAQSNADWKFAVLQLERGRSHVERGFAECHLPACRRAKRCVGNPPVCTARCELEPGAEHDLVDEFYADIQEQRRDAAAADDWPPEVEQVLHYLKEDNEEIEAIAEPSPEATPRTRNKHGDRQGGGAERCSASGAETTVAGAAAKTGAGASGAAAATFGIAVTDPATGAGPRRVEAERIAGAGGADQPHLGRLCRRKTDASTEPRIRLLSDDNDAWGVPPWWKGRR